jgi:hypothetical protein
MTTLHLLIGALIYLGGLVTQNFLPSYLKKKGENLATKEDIQELAKQTAILTQTTKEIEARISIEVWARQQRWDVQKTALLESLKELATAETFLSRLVYTFSRTTEKHGDWAEQRKEANEKYADAINNFRRTLLSTEIVCGRAIGDQLQVIDGIFNRMLKETRQGDFDKVWSQDYPALVAAKKELGQTIRTQLEFDPQLGGGELSLSSPPTSSPMTVSDDVRV